MKSGQFYRGKIDGIQKNYESPDLGELLPSEKLCALANRTQTGEYSNFFRNERVIARTVVVPTENSDGRRGGTINHTVLYQFDREIEHETAPYIFDTEQFIDEILAGKRKFKMPPPPELPSNDSIRIGFPPPLEWEVET